MLVIAVDNRLVVVTGLDLLPGTDGLHGTPPLTTPLRDIRSPPAMRTYLYFLRRHPVWWLTPILLYLGALLWLASLVARTPDNPFAYTLY